MPCDAPSLGRALFLGSWECMPSQAAAWLPALGKRQAFAGASAPGPRLSSGQKFNTQSERRVLIMPAGSTLPSSRKVQEMENLFLSSWKIMRCR
ncbi:Uncharacterised protein [Chromobacterium violaceum]|uniref:Uncharacterized protein n=1 Tax=Chromobacterium violaceum TaxID=536 RepID=A0A3S4IXZ8_CHRVL|nr:Uncharacterised protein [Chromobacterium violaceum]